MNTQTITLTPPIDGVQYGISDEPINLNDWYVDDTNAIRQSIISQSDSDYWLRRTDYKKVILSTNPKDLRFPFLVMPSKEQEVERLIYGCFGKTEWDAVHKNAKLALIESFINNPAKYTQEQMEKAIDMAREKQFVNVLGECDKYDTVEILQSLQPTVKAVRVEMEEIRSPEFGNCQHFKEVGCIKDICTCYTLKIKVETSSEYPQGIVRTIEAIN